MTVIVYRSGVMASDTLVTEPDHYLKSYYARKIIKTADGCLAGASGDCEYCCNFLDWAQTDRTKPAPKAGKDDAAILVLSTGEIRCYYGRVYDIVLNDYMAIGAGATQALACLFCGADANTSVAAACHVNMACGGEIISELL